MPPKKKTTAKKPVVTPAPLPPKMCPFGAIIGTTCVITAIVAVSLMYSWHSKEMKKVEILNSKSCVEVAQLNAEQQNEINDLTNDVASLEEEKNNLMTLMQVVENPKEGWETYIPAVPEDENSEEEVVSELVGKDVDEVRELLGEPPVLLRNYPTSQVWVYHTSSEEATGLYVMFEENEVVEIILDEFNGVDILPTLLN
ncbi:hypothetical protein C0581_02060 [Candidatus Parcubacteria bacterium]|nr:MAG: hypothetical protein C0581_02060 [Candidatus Parcubacteria bacterium]